jgi:hypothetical protein
MWSILKGTSFNIAEFIAEFENIKLVHNIKGMQKELSSLDDAGVINF